MSIPLEFDRDQIEFVKETLEATIALLDNVHCYDTEEIQNCRASVLVLAGYSIKDAIEEANENQA